MMGGQEKLHQEKLHDASEKHQEKYSEESFCVKSLSNFFSILAMCHETLDGHKKLVRGVKNFFGVQDGAWRGHELFLKATHH